MKKRRNIPRARRAVTIACVLASWVVYSATAVAEDPPKPAVDLDKLLDDFLKIDVAALRAKQEQLAKRIAETPAQAKAFRDRAGGADQQAAALRARLDVVGKLSAALKDTTPMPAAGSPSPAASRPAGEPNVDQLLDALLKLDPKQLAAKQSALESEISRLVQEGKSLRDQAAAMEAQVAVDQQRMALIPKLIAVFDPPKVAANKPPAPAPEPPAPAMQPAPKPEPAAPAPAMTPAPEPAKQPAAPAATQPAQAMNAAGSAKAITVNFRDHVVPIFSSRCTGCHNPDKAKGGLNLTTFQTAIEGGSSGTVIASGDPGGSRLYRLVSHAEEPNMPPLESKLPDDQLATIKTWIAQGAAESPDSGPTASVAAAIPTTPKLKQLVTARTADGPPPMPEQPGGIPLVSGPPPAVRALAVSPTAPLAAVSGVGKILLYNLDTLALAGVFPFDEGTPQALQFSIDGRVLVCAGGQAGRSGCAAAYDIITGERLGKYGEAYDAHLAVALSPDGGLVLVGGPSRRARAYDTDSAEMVYEITAHNDWIQAIAVNAYGDLVATGDRAGGLFVWELETGREVHVLRGHTGAISALSFSGETDILASTSEDGTVRLWEMEEGRQLRSFAAHDQASLAVAFAGDGRLATCGADRRARIWQQDGKLIRSIDNLSDWVYCVAFDAGGNRLIAGTWDGRVGVWDAATGKPLGELVPAAKPDETTT